MNWNWGLSTGMYKFAVFLLPTILPPLESSEYIMGSSKRLINFLLNGMQKKITIQGKQYNGLMPRHSFLSDKDLALMLIYIRQNFNIKSGK